MSDTVEMPLDVLLFAEEDIALEADGEREKEDAPSNLQNIPADPADIREDIKSKFLVEMPEDFYQFWEFAKSLHPKNPQGYYSLCTTTLCKWQHTILCFETIKLQQL